MPKMVVGVPMKHPVSLHILITSRCNLSCTDCYYRGRNDTEIPKESLFQIISEYVSLGGQSLAIGGGEPLLHPNIEEIINFSKGLGIYTAVTTNGTVLKHIKADRVHISYDEIHFQTGKKQVIDAINFHRENGCKVGINHILTSITLLEEVLCQFGCTITVLLEKPSRKFIDWEKFWNIYRKNYERIWVDPCLAKLQEKDFCRQGYSSMSIDSRLMAGICSNTKKKIPFISIEKTWKDIIREGACLYTKNT